MPSKPPASPMNIRFVIQILVALFLISFGGLLLQYEGVFRRTQSVAKQEGEQQGQQQQEQQQVEEEEEPVTIEENLFGVVLSVKDERFQHTREVLTNLGVTVAQKLPPPYMSKEVDVGLERFVGSRQFHSDASLKVWSNRMAFIEALEEFVQNSSCTRNSWRFFFEDDLAIHPSVNPDLGKILVAKGLRLASPDGFVYLGLCGPDCPADENPKAKLLDRASGAQAELCFGTCAHAFGFQRWKAGEFLREMSGLSLEVAHALYFDRYLYEYGKQVRRVWVVGSNLRSPAKQITDHIGLLYQDRDRYPSTIGNR